jgi:hypothetical protein
MVAARSRRRRSPVETDELTEAAEEKRMGQTEAGWIQSAF